MAASPAVDAGRVIADLRELDRLTGGHEGARRLCWTETWREARGFLGGLLEEIGLVPERDEAGNLWAYLEGDSEPALALGSHIDSVPAGGWLDGALGVMAAVGVLRAWAGSGRPPPRTLALVDWADEEGARFGRSLFGSSAFAGTLEPDRLRNLRDGEGHRLPEVLSENGVEVDRALASQTRRERLSAYLELHIEQGPVLEAEGVHAAAVDGCVGIERHRFTIRGQASHAGTTPMDARHDAGLAAADAALRIEAVATLSDGVATTGVLELAPGIPTAVPGEARLTVDLRHPDASTLATMLAEASDAVNAAAGERDCDADAEEIWRIDPLPFDPGLVAMAQGACAQVAGVERTITSGALHDAAEVARILPAAMVFCPSKRGLSHAPQEDTAEEDLVVGIQALGLLSSRLLGRV